MFLFRVLLIALLGGAMAFAQSAPSPAGHWAGTLHVPDKPVSFELDLLKNGDGTLGGTITFPDEHIAGLPLVSVTLAGSTLSFRARDDQQFTGTLSEDGASMNGKLDVEQYHVPVTLARTGDAHAEPPAAIAPVASDLEGEWAATVDRGGQSIHLRLSIANRTNGAAATLTNVEEGHLRVPVSTIVRDGSSVTFGLPIVGASFIATLNGNATELAGSYTQGGRTLPLTFERTPAGRK